MSITERSLRADIKKMGIRAGDVVIIHASMKSIGPVRGGPEAVIRAFQRVVTPRGAVIMPTFSYCFEKIYEPVKPYDPAASPSQVGLLSETFRRMKGVARSLHPTHSVAAWGKSAQELVEGHDKLSGLSAGSPFHRAALKGAKICMIGCGFTSLSLLHVAEAIAELPFLPVFNWWHAGWKPSALMRKTGRDKTRPSTYETQSNVSAVEGHAPSCPQNYFDNMEIEQKVYPSIPGCSRNFGEAEELARKRGLILAKKLGHARVLLADASTVLNLIAGRLREEPGFLLCPAGECRACDERRAVLEPASPAEKFVREFIVQVVNRAGIRLAGSAGENMAAEIIAGQMKALGLDNVAVHRFPITAWRPGYARLSVNVNGKWENFPAAPVSHGPATPPRGIEGKAVILENAADIAKVSKSGADIAVLWGNFGVSAGEFQNLMNSRLKAFIFVDTRFEHEDIVSVGPPAQWIRHFKRPMISMPFPAAVRIFGHGPARCRLSVTGQNEASTSSVVTGEIAGTGGGVILVSGHHDSTFNSPAPDDNLSGVATALAIAAKLKSGRGSLRHTIRFCSFGTEEILSEGARWYALKSGLADDVRFVVNNDGVGSRVGCMSAFVAGAPALTKWLASRVRQTPLQIQVVEIIDPFSDHFPFNARGIPALWFYRSSTPSGRHFHHTVRDTLAEISFKGIAELAEFEAHLVAELARRAKFPFPLNFPPRIKAEIEKKRRDWLT